MIYALDTEFMEDGNTIDLLSLALVDVDGRSLYFENPYADLDKANHWVTENVLPHLHISGCPDDGHNCPITVKMFYNDWLADIQQRLIKFVGNRPVFCGYYCAYDWVVLCQLFGPMINLPESWPMYCHDLRSWLDINNLSGVKQPDDMPHHALSDARWIMQTLKRYNFLTEGN